jgi:hypothetical protein
MKLQFHSFTGLWNTQCQTAVSQSYRLVKERVSSQSPIKWMYPITRVYMCHWHLCTTQSSLVMWEVNLLSCPLSTRNPSPIHRHRHTDAQVSTPENWPWVLQPVLQNASAPGAHAPRLCCCCVLPSLLPVYVCVCACVCARVCMCM